MLNQFVITDKDTKINNKFYTINSTLNGRFKLRFTSIHYVATSSNSPSDSREVIIINSSILKMPRSNLASNENGIVICNQGRYYAFYEPIEVVSYLNGQSFDLSIEKKGALGVIPADFKLLILNFTADYLGDKIPPPVKEYFGVRVTNFTAGEMRVNLNGMYKYRIIGYLYVDFNQPATQQGRELVSDQLFPSSAIITNNAGKGLFLPSRTNMVCYGFKRMSTQIGRIENLLSYKLLGTIVNGGNITDVILYFEVESIH